MIEDDDRRLWAVDHGLAFNVDPKLRTVIWELAESAVSPAEGARLEGLASILREPEGLRPGLAKMLSPEETTATLSRVEDLLSVGCYPAPSHARHLPWPLV